MTQIKKETKRDRMRIPRGHMNNKKCIQRLKHEQQYFIGFKTRGDSWVIEPDKTRAANDLMSLLAKKFLKLALFET